MDRGCWRRAKEALGVNYKAVRKDPLIVLMPRDHDLAARKSIRPQDISGETFIGVSPIRAPTLWAVINDYIKRAGIAVKPDHQAENIAMSISLVPSTAGCARPP